MKDCTDTEKKTQAQTKQKSDFHPFVTPYYLSHSLDC